MCGRVACQRAAAARGKEFVLNSVTRRRLTRPSPTPTPPRKVQSVRTDSERAGAPGGGHSLYKLSPEMIWEGRALANNQLGSMLRSLSVLQATCLRRPATSAMWPRCSGLSLSLRQRRSKHACHSC